MHLACGLSVGLTGLAAGYAIGIVGDMVGLLKGFCDAPTNKASRASDRICNNRESLWE